MVKFLKILFVVVVVFAITNPSVDKHRAEVRSLWEAEVTKSMGKDTSSVLKLLGFSGVGKVLIDAEVMKITRTTYLLFSLGVYEGEPISFGVLGNVFIPRDNSTN